MRKPQDKVWTGKTGGTRRMQESLIAMFRHFNPWWVSPIVALWVLGYIIVQKEGRGGIYYYWHNRQHNSVLSACWHLYATYFWFGMAIMDKFAAYAGRKYQTRIDGDANIFNAQGGCIVLSSHVGNQELAGYTFPSSRPMHVLTYMGDTETVHDNRKRMFEQMNLHLLPMEADGSHIYAMHEVLERGEILSIHGDRLFLGQRALQASILGEKANFPFGTFRLAALESVPVVTMFMMKEHGNNYTLYLRKLSDGRPEGMDNQTYMKFLLSSYVGEMEGIIRKYPHQWFQFYRFWNKNQTNDTFGKRSHNFTPKPQTT